MSALEKTVDNLGRIVIPTKFREKLGIKPDSTVLISLDDDVISIIPSEKRCALCGGTVDDEVGIRLCTDCIKTVKSLE